MNVDEPAHAAGWAALLADVLGRPGQRTVLSALERPIRGDTYRLLEAAWADQGSEPSSDDGAVAG